MIASLFVFLGLVLFSLLSNQKGQEKAALCTLGLTLLLVYMALDIHRIHDVPNYEDSFYFYKDYTLSQIKRLVTSTELGYIALNVIVAKIYPNFKLFYFIYAVFIITSYLSFIRRYSKNIRLSGIILVCMFFYPLFLMRQYFAMSICLLSIPLIFKRKPFLFALCMYLAFLFHRSAIVFSLCYFLPLLEVNRKNVVFVTIVGSIIVASIGFFDSIIESVVMGSRYAYHYGVYLEEGSANSWKSAAVAIADMVFVLFCYRVNFENLSKEQSFFFYMCIVYSILAIIGAVGSIFQAVYRVLPYFNISVIVLLPDAAAYIKNKTVRTVSLTAIIGFYAVLLISMAKSWVYFTF